METFERLRNIIRETLQPKQEITPESTFIELGADSLDLVEILMACEEEFNVEVPDKDAEKLKTVQQIVDYIDDKAGQ